MKENREGYFKRSYKGALALILVTLSFSGFAAEKLPTPEDYPAVAVNNGQIANDIDCRDEFTQRYRTRFKEAMQGKIVFAGEYALAEWGCGGAGCHTVALINKRTGRALNKAFSVYYGSDDENPVAIGEEIIFMQPESRLLITAGVDEINNKTFTYYYVLKKDELKLIRKVEGYAN